ncbi:MAG: WD40 repeat domain-containing protein [Chloroflexota bacterium]
MYEDLQQEIIEASIPYFETRLERLELLYGTTLSEVALDRVNWSLGTSLFVRSHIATLSKPVLISIMQEILQKAPHAQALREVYVELQGVNAQYWPPVEKPPDEEELSLTASFEWRQASEDQSSGPNQFERLAKWGSRFADLQQLSAVALAGVGMIGLLIGLAIFGEREPLSQPPAAAEAEVIPSLRSRHPHYISLDAEGIPQHQNWVQSVSFDPNGNVIASVSNDKTLRLWDLTVEIPLTESQVLGRYDGAILAGHFSPDGSMIAIGGFGNTVWIYDQTGIRRSPAVLLDVGDTILSLAFSPDSRFIAVGSADNNIRIWDLEQPSDPPLLLEGHRYWVWSVAFSPDGQQLVSSSGDLTIRVWDLSQPEEEPAILAGHDAFIISVAISPDGELLASADTSGTIGLWQLGDFAADEVFFEAHPEGVRSIAFSPDGTTLATGGDDRKIKLWQINELTAAPQELIGHVDLVSTVAFSPDGQYLASGGIDNTVRLWKIREE